MEKGTFMSDRKSPVIFLKGERVYLRPLEVGDADRCQHWINDPEVRRYMAQCFPLNGIAERGWIESLGRNHPPTSIQLAIVLLDGNHHIGNLGVQCIDWVHRDGETGTVIGEKEYWGQGFGREAKTLLLEYLFDTLGLYRVHSRVYAPNLKSQKSLIATGYKREGCQRQAVFLEGKREDVLLFGLLAGEWRARNQNDD